MRLLYIYSTPVQAGNKAYAAETPVSLRAPSLYDGRDCKFCRHYMLHRVLSPQQQLHPWLLVLLIS